MTYLILWMVPLLAGDATLCSLSMWRLHVLSVSVWGFFHIPKHVRLTGDCKLAVGESEWFCVSLN